MKKIFTILSISLACHLQAQNLFTEDFNALNTGFLNGQNSWTANSSNGGSGECVGISCDPNRFYVINNPLTAPTNSVIGCTSGKAIKVNLITPNATCLSMNNPSGEGQGHLFTSVTSGSVYVSFLLRVDRPSSAQGDVFRVASSAFSPTFRLMTRGSGNAYQFYLQSNSNSAEATDGATRSTGTTYAIVVKYTFPTGGNTQGQIDLFVNPTAGTEPAPTFSRSAATGINDATAANRIMFPHNSTCVNRPDFTMACLKVGTSWLSVIPVELVDFSAKVKQNATVLTWKTASENNVRHFDIERSADGQHNWQTIGTVKATGNSAKPVNYQFSDETPLSTNYYRLRSVDNDGKNATSKIISINRLGGKLSLNTSISSLHTEGGVLSFDINVERQGNLKVFLTDILGRTALTRIYTTTEGSNQIQVNTSTLAKGVYMVNMTDGENSIVVKMVKQ